MKAARWAAAPLAAVLLLVVGVATVADMSAQAAATSCTSSAPGVTVTGVPGGTVAGYSGDQLANAAAIVTAGHDHALDVRGQTIGVMTAMGESSLHEIAYGDAAGPDSRGLFQQRDPWGSLADRMNPYRSAVLFFTGGEGGQRGLLDVPGWETMAPTLAAHAVQVNADPYHYERYWDAAVAVVQALAGSGVSVTGVATGGGGNACAGQPTSPGVPGDGWVNPDPGATLTSGYGWRTNPVTGGSELHAGQDMAAPCGTPILAAHAGVIIKAGVSSGFGDAIFEDAGGGVQLWYGHEYADGILVHVGDQVQAGQTIGLVGANGQATGCHDHFQVNVNGTPTDPVPFMAARGVRLGPSGL